jgi:hypothetical protein
MSNIIEKFKLKYGYLEEIGMLIRGVYGSPLNAESEDMNISTSQGLDENELHLLKDFNGYKLCIGHPFIFDNRILPQKFETIELCVDIYGDFPKEFDIIDQDRFISIDEYWNPDKYIKYVDRCFDEIKKTLKYHNATKEELLDALSPNGNFKKHINEMEKIKIERIIGL